MIIDIVVSFTDNHYICFMRKNVEKMLKKQLTFKNIGDNIIKLIAQRRKHRECA